MEKALFKPPPLSQLYFHKWEVKDWKGGKKDNLKWKKKFLVELLFLGLVY